MFQATKCDSCGDNLELPATHFLCRHSFHTKCLNKPRECNICTGVRQTTKERRDQFEKEASGGLDDFVKHVKSAEDKYGVMTQYMARGIFNRRYQQGDTEGGAFDDEGDDDDRW